MELDTIEALGFAENLARKAGEIMRTHFLAGVKTNWKEDKTPITITDTTINEMVLKAVDTKYPDHSFIGEEGSNIKESEYAWVCDPVDGTTPFTHGYPLFTFSLALTKNGESILGVVYDPTNDRLLTATKGGGAFLNGKTISVSKDREFNDTTFVGADCDYKLEPIRKILIEKGCYVPVLYAGVYAGLLVACGEFAASIYEYQAPWDGAAIKIIVEEAGGKVTDLAGNEQRYDGQINGFIASNGLLHDELVKIISSLIS